MEQEEILRKSPESGEGIWCRLNSLTANQFRLALGAIFFLALSLRLAYLNQMSQGIYFNILKMNGTDCFIFWQWALEITEKDFLGDGIYHQSPLYPYFLAAMFKVFGGNFYIPRFFQMVLGSLTCVMAGLLGRRAGGDVAGIFAAILAAIYGPMILYDGAILRTNLITFINTLVILLMFRVQDKLRFTFGLWLGIAVGFAILAKENMLIMLPGLIFWLYLCSRKTSYRLATHTGVGMALGIVLILGLLMARNMAVGVRPLAISSRGAIEFISGNVPQASGVGWAISPNTNRIVEASDGKMTKVIWEVLKENREDPLGLVSQQFRKLFVLISDYEYPNNISLYVEKRYVSFFSFPWPGFSAILAFGLLGIVIVIRRWRELFPLYVYLGLYTIGTVAFYIIARFRIPLMPVLIVFAGVALAKILQASIERKFLFGLALVVSAIILIVLGRSYPPDRLLISDYQNMIRYHLISGQKETARNVLKEGLSTTRQILALEDSAAYRYRLASLLYMSEGDSETVIAELDRALELKPRLSLKLSIRSLRNNLLKKKEMY